MKSIGYIEAFSTHMQELFGIDLAIFDRAILERVNRILRSAANADRRDEDANEAIALLQIATSLMSSDREKSRDLFLLVANLPGTEGRVRDLAMDAFMFLEGDKYAGFATLDEVRRAMQRMHRDGNHRRYSHW